MRKVLSLILAVTMLFALTVSVSGCGSDTDYSSPIRAVTAYKTVSVTATMDCGHAPGASRTFYVRNSELWSAKVYVCPNEGSGTDVIKGQTVTFVITGIDDHNAPTFYLEGDVVS